MIGLRDCVQELISLQLDEHGDAEIKAQQTELNDLYDSFIAEFGLINSQANNRAFNADSAYYLLSSLEILDEDGELDRKADMFTKRTIKQKTVITHVDTASEALAVSIGERTCVDMEYMQELTGFTPEMLILELRGIIFQNPEKTTDPLLDGWETADEYLSGNVREKLRVAEEYNEKAPHQYRTNVDALKAVQPKDLEAGEIGVRLGATWIDPKYVQDFMYELLDTSYYNKKIYEIKYHSYTGEWQVTGKGKSQYSDINATVTYGTGRMNAYQIIDDTLNLRDVRVYDYKEDADGKEHRVLNKKETTLAQQKQEIIKQAFKDWLWKDPERRQTLVQEYNERFNSIRPREYDGSHITFNGISPEIALRSHQLNAIAHILYGGNTLLAHEVGAGKTFEMVGAAMESKRLGQCQKSLFAVPNHLTEQWAGEFLRLYPSANILVATKKDFEMRNRKKFCAKIATGDYDAVIIGHSQLEKIPMSKERQERLLREQLWDIEDGIRDLKASNGERFSIKQLEKTKKSLEARLAKLLDAKTRDDVVTFEQLGVDRLYIDEAHNFKNLFMYTKMRNVAGLSTSEAQKSSDLFMKCRYLDELTDNKGVVFATGTPISNSMTELYTMQRYLQYDALLAKNLKHFDAWASIFGETQTSIELSPEGNGYRARTRFAKFHNLPELMCLFKQVADIQTADMLNLPVPEAKYETVIVEPSDLQKEMVQELSERAAAVHNREVEPQQDNMLKITTDGRKIGLDQRLINPMLPDFEGSKVNACTDNVFKVWEETKSDRLTQLVFCDFSTPNKDGRFNVYDDIRSKLLERGIPESEIAFIHDADTETRKKELFAKVRQGKVRVLFGSTFKMGAGTNVQDRLIAIHDADCPWRPADLAQRSGRIIRQGNNNPEVRIFRYATSGTFVLY
jgi:N12 class adenine-specific DNA methylase